MKKLLPYVITALLCCATANMGRAQEQKHKEPDTELGKTMEKMNGAWRKLRKQVADPASNAASLELVATIKAAADKSLTLTPEKAADIPAADREKFVADYQKHMKDFTAQVAKLGDALKANDNAAAQAIMKDMGGMQKEGHKDFKKPDM